MKTVIRPSLALALLSIPPCFLAAGCGSTSAPTAARNTYVLQAAQTNSVETDSVLVFPTTAAGASTPASTLSMPSGFYAYSLATGPKGEIYVGGEVGNDGPGKILVFAAGAKGSASPVTTYTGGGSGTFDFPDFLTVNDKGQLFVMSDDGSIEGFAANAASTDAPTQYITTYQTEDTFSYGIGADSVGNIYVDEVNGRKINVFGAGATGAATPTRTITGTNANSFGYLFGITADADGNVMVVSFNPSDDPFQGVHSKFAHARQKSHLRHDLSTVLEQAKAHSDSPAAMVATGIYTFAADASGAATPTIAISGSATTVNEPESMTADALNNIYYVDFEGGTLTFMSFKAGATGNVAPTTSATSSAYNNSNWIAVIAAY